MNPFEPVLSTISPLWALTNTVARKLYQGKAKKLDIPVISIGNIVAGGVGKTEIAALIAAKLVAQGERVVVASRGYASQWESKGAVAFDLHAAQSLAFPDEALVILKKSPGAAVAVGADRYSNLKKHWDELSPDVVLLDDGFQHFKLARDLDVLVHDFSLPWPVLRELPGALRKAGLRVAFSEVPEKWRAIGPWVRVRYQLIGASDSAGRLRALPKEALAFCGLGNPVRFRRALETAGVKLRGFRAFRDHVGYDEQHVRALVAWQRKTGLPLLTSLKDSVKLNHFVESLGGVAGFEPSTVEIRLEFLENEDHFWRTIQEVLA